MRNRDQLHFPCSESPLRLYLSVAAAATDVAADRDDGGGPDGREDDVPADAAGERGSAEAEAANGRAGRPSPEGAPSSPSWESREHLYLGLHPLDVKKVRVAGTPHEWSLLWSTARGRGAAAPESGDLDGDSSSGEEEEDGGGGYRDGVRSSAFFLRSTDRKVFLTCDAEGNLSTCTGEYLRAKQEQEQEEELALQDETAARAAAAPTTQSTDGQGSFTWTLDYEDESGMVVGLINTTYQRKLAILHPGDYDASNPGKNNEKPICTTLPVVTKALAEDGEDDRTFPNASPSSSPPSPATSTTRWRMRFRSGELLFLSNPTVRRRLRCNAFGKLSLDENRKGWEVFRFVEAGHGGRVQIASWTHDSHLLYSNRHGTVGTTRNVESPNTLWEVARFRRGGGDDDDGTPAAAGGVLLRSVRHGRYLSALSGTELATVEERDFPFAAVQWELEAANSNLFFLTTTTTTTTAPPSSAASRSSSSAGSGTDLHFLSSRPNGDVFSAKRGRDWEEWKLEAVPPEGKIPEGGEGGDCKLSPNGGPRAPADLFSLYSTKHGRYLGSSEDGTVHTAESRGESEYWELEESPNGCGGYVLVSHLHGDRQLVCDREGELRTSTTECQAWTLRPRMPASTTKGQMAVAGVAVATALVASPLSLALGAAARAPLAAMMVGGAAEAAAAEAAVVCGVGTAVLGTAAAAAAIITTADRKDEDAKRSQRDGLPIRPVNRPLVGWRTW